MKRIILLALLFACIAILNSGCNNKKNIPLDKAGTYLGFSNLPDSADYTIEDAIEDGCLVFQNSKIIANDNIWESFIKSSLNKENSHIRIAKFYDDETIDTIYLDLFYEKEYFYLFETEAKSHEHSPYLYLLTLEGQYGNPKKDTKVIILTDDKTLTFETVMKVLYSSNLDYKKSVPNFRILFFYDLI